MQGAARLRFSAICPALLLVGACTSSGMLSNRAIDFNEAIAEAADAQLLLNVVRAAYRNPTHYTAVSQLREIRLAEGSLTAGGTFPFGPTAPRTYSLTPSVNVKANEQPSLDIAPLDNRTSASGLLRSIEEQTFVDYWKKAWPKDVLFHLLVDDVAFNERVKTVCKFDRQEFALALEKKVIKEIGVGKGKRYWIDNNVSQFTLVKTLFDCLAREMQLAEGDKEDDKGNKMILCNASIPPRDILKKLPELKDFKIKEEKSGSYTIRKLNAKKAAFTFGEATKQNNEKKKNEEVDCSKKDEEESELSGLTVTFAGPVDQSRASVSMTLRSVDGMIYYLGELVRFQIAGDPPPPLKEGRILFKVDIDDPAPTKSVQVDYLGHRFSIQRKNQTHDLLHGKDRTLTMLTLLSQLFALYREDKDLPKTTAVQVVGGQ
jgi:hypothetical protein